MKWLAFMKNSLDSTPLITIDCLIQLYIYLFFAGSSKFLLCYKGEYRYPFNTSGKAIIITKANYILSLINMLIIKSRMTLFNYKTENILQTNFLCIKVR
jgi:hypothetical protein